MARPNLITHRKFIEFANELGDAAKALGHLEFLWQAQYESCSPLIGSEVVVEHQARWRGKRGKLVEMLCRAGLIDASPDGYVVHDFWDHAPDYVRKRRHREESRRVTGAKLLSGQHQVTSQSPVNDRTLTSTPAPAPAPSRETTTRARGPAAAGSRLAEFDVFWAAYPRKVGKGAAERAWLASAKVRPALPELLQAVERAKTSGDWQRDGGQYIPHPSTWLNQRRWEDAPRPAAPGGNGKYTGSGRPVEIPEETWEALRRKQARDLARQKAAEEEAL